MCIIPVPVRPYVKKFIAARYRQDIWQLNRQDRIGKILYLALEHMPKLYKKSKLNYGETLMVDVCPEYMARRGVYLSDEAVAEFNDAIHLEIIESVALYAFQVKNRVGLKKYKELYVTHKTSSRETVRRITNPDLFQYIEKREVIYDILKLYDITEDDLPFETISKAWQRMKLPLLTA